jgi:hypothetical protein
VKVLPTKLLGIVAAIALVAGGVTWWLVVREPDYCGQVEDRSAKVQAGGGVMQNVVEGLPELRQLADAAPSDLKDEWQVVVNAIDGMRQAFVDTGVDPTTTDLDALPDTVTVEQRQRLKSAASKLVSPEVQAAVNGIQQQALDVCHTPLEL